MQGGVKWRAISPHHASNQGEFVVTTKHAMRGAMVGYFALPSMQGGMKWWAISPHKAFNKDTMKESLG